MKPISPGVAALASAGPHRWPAAGLNLPDARPSRPLPTQAEPVGTPPPRSVDASRFFQVSGTLNAGPGKHREHSRRISKKDVERGRQASYKQAAGAILGRDDPLDGEVSSSRTGARDS